MTRTARTSTEPNGARRAARCLNAARALALALSLLFLAFSLAGCKEAPAAVVDGVEISEADVTAQIEYLRGQVSGTDEESWARYLIQSDMTPEKLRETVIAGKVESILLDKHASELGIEIADGDVQKLYDDARASFSDDEEWKSYLDYMGLTDEAYRASLREYLTQEAIHDHFQGGAEYSEGDVEEAAQYYISAYGGTKRAEEAVVPIENPGDAESIAAAENLARSIYEMASNGGMSLEEAAEAADPDGLAGVLYVEPEWGIIEARGDKYAGNFAGVGIGQVADPTTGIASVEVFKIVGQLPEAEQNPKFESLPADIQEQVRQITQSNIAGTSFQAWYREIWDKSTIRVNPAPSPLPYDVDLEKYRAQVEAEQAGQGGE